jgi:trehalose/maltose transport system substrate-binding protein
MRRSFISIVALVLSAAVGIGVWWYFTSSQAARGPVTLNISCGATEHGFELCQRLAQEFAEEKGWQITARPAPADATLHLSVLQELTATQSTGYDVFMVDVIWPGMLADQLLDLRPYFSHSDLQDFFPSIVENNTVNGKLVAIPYYTDAGLLYYRGDLLAKYGYAQPPQTWEDLERMARAIQEGERAEGKGNFWGYVWQGRQSESLTCDALEWFASEGAGHVVDADGTISIDNPVAVRALQRAQSWVGTISPPETHDIAEEEARAIWQAGNAAFMRNWPYAYGLGNAQGSQVRGRFDVAPLPQGDKGGAATLGGWQMAVNRYTRFPAEAAELVRYMTSQEVQKVRAIEGSYNPTRQSLYRDDQVLSANPFFEHMPDILAATVARPSGVTGSSYEAVSSVIYTEVNQVLTRVKTPEQAIRAMDTALRHLKGEGW